MIDERNKQHQRTIDMKAFLAVHGMRKGELPDQLEEIERLYHKWLGITFNDEGVLYSMKWYSRIKWWLLWKLFKTPATVFRQQILLLSQAHVTVMNNQAAAAQQASHAADYIRLTMELRDLHSFCAQHFRNELALAESRKIKLLDVCRDIMLRRKCPVCTEAALENEIARAAAGSAERPLEFEELGAEKL